MTPRRNESPEYLIHRSIADFLFLALPEGGGVQWEHSPLGGKRNLFAAIKFKRMGAKAGRLDLRFRWNDATGRNTAWLEIKAPDGSTNEAQDKFIAECATLGDICAVVESRKEAYAVLKAWGLPMKAAIDDNDMIRTPDGRLVLKSGKMNYTPPMRALKRPSKRALKAARGLWGP